MSAGDATADAAIARAVAAAHAIGVELDPAEAAAWLRAVTAESAGGTVAVDVDSGVYGHRVSIADFDPAVLARSRALAAIVGVPARPPVLETAIALSGSAAQGRVQRFPADADFFQRLHVRAPDRAAAVTVVADALRAHAVAHRTGPGYRLWEAKWGTHDEAGSVRGVPVRPGTPISWAPDEVVAGSLRLERPDGSVRAIGWDDAPGRPGWCKLDWIVADRASRTLGNASNVIDPTWEGPDGAIVPLDGFLEPYFQEVYLDAGSIPLFERIVGELGEDAIERYVEELEAEVTRYITTDPNHGKAARRAYNIFRLTGRYAEAAWLRELFDEPVTALYQVAALLGTVEDAAGAFEDEVVLGQIDRLTMASVQALDGLAEAEMVDRLRALRAAIADRADAGERASRAGDARTRALDAVDAYFRRALRSVPSIATWLDELAARAPGREGGPGQAPSA